MVNKKWITNINHLPCFHCFKASCYKLSVTSILCSPFMWKSLPQYHTHGTDFYMNTLHHRAHMPFSFPQFEWLQHTKAELESTSLASNSQFSNHWATPILYFDSYCKMFWNLRIFFTLYVCTTASTKLMFEIWVKVETWRAECWIGLCANSSPLKIKFIHLFSWLLFLHIFTHPSECILYITLNRLSLHSTPLPTSACLFFFFC